MLFKEEIKSLHEKVDDLNDVVEQMEQHERRNTLRFHNVPLTADQINLTDDVIVQLLKANLDVTITGDDIDKSHIIGRINNNNKAQVSCIFKTWNIKNKIFKTKSKLAKNPDKTFISEDLTQPRRELIFRLNQLHRTNVIHSFWTHDGVIFAKISDSSRKIKMSSHSDINNIDPSIAGSSVKNVIITIYFNRLSCFFCYIFFVCFVFSRFRLPYYTLPHPITLL